MNTITKIVIFLFKQKSKNGILINKYNNDKISGEKKKVFKQIIFFQQKKNIFFRNFIKKNWDALNTHLMSFEFLYFYILNNY